MNRVTMAVVLVITGLAGYAYGQMASTGTMIGTVTDPSGAVVPAAKIDLKDLTTGNVRTSLSNGSGQYSFVGVQPGTYSASATHAGFRAMSVPRVVVEVGKSYNINLSLEVGAAQTVVEVAATPGAELQTLDASVGLSSAGKRSR